jgi:hypothetical protein
MIIKRKKERKLCMMLSDFYLFFAGMCFLNSYIGVVPFRIRVASLIMTYALLFGNWYFYLIGRYDVVHMYGITKGSIHPQKIGK